MKFLRDFFCLPAVTGRLFARTRRGPVHRTITVPTPLPAAGRVIEMHSRVATKPLPNDAAIDEPRQRVVNL